jgi:hypothetical protein
MEKKMHKIKLVLLSLVIFWNLDIAAHTEHNVISVKNFVWPDDSYNIGTYQTNMIIDNASQWRFYSFTNQNLNIQIGDIVEIHPSDATHAFMFIPQTGELFLFEKLVSTFGTEFWWTND